MWRWKPGYLLAGKMKKIGYIVLWMLLILGNKVCSQNIDNEEVLKKYFLRNIRYPFIARENNEQGQVVMSFGLNTDADIVDITVVKTFGKECSDEVLRVLKNIGHISYLQPSTYTFSVNFRMDNGSAPMLVAPEKEVKNYLFGIEIIGYGSVKKTDYIVDRTYTMPKFDRLKDTTKVKKLVIYRYGTKDHGNVLVDQHILNLNKRGDILEKDYYRTQDGFSEKTLYQYEASGHQEILTRFRNKKQEVKTVSCFARNGALLNQSWYNAKDSLTNTHEYPGNIPEPASAESRHSYIFDSQHRVIEDDFYLPGNAKPIFWDTYKYNNNGDKIEEVTDIMVNRPVGNKSTFGYAAYDKQGNWHKATWGTNPDSISYVIKRKITYW